MRLRILSSDASIIRLVRGVLFSALEIIVQHLSFVGRLQLEVMFCE